MKRAQQQATGGGLESLLRQIIREELQSALADLGAPLAPKAYVGSAELMTSLSISRGTLRKMMKEGLPYTQPGKYPRFAVAEVDTWLAARSTGSLA